MALADLLGRRRSTGPLTPGPATPGPTEAARDAEVERLRQQVESLTAALAESRRQDDARHRLASRTLEDSLERTRQEDRAAQERAHAQRLASARHDLRQPLQAMRMFLYLLGQRLTTDAQRDLADKLEQALEATDALLAGDLLGATPPSRPPPPPAQTAPTQTAPDQTTSLAAGALVAVVEDDALQLAALESLLEEWGCTVVTATRQDELRQALAGRAPALVLSDNRLPDGARGIALIQEVRRAAGLAADSPALPALLLTGDTSPELATQAKAAGICVLAKPLTPSRLRDSVACALKKAAASRP